ncbi:MAG: hypothetical protein AVDCRST_MAG26-735 [uncultured Chloroflexia bacterium]|uniref:Uncharacterized protein n=1 Tax=uncultured Chloroflexia bacterium TaxID=1672391 RepID=A0A6J4HJF2_9CHLR|nr:MAG: hypothetical protein AVDCRST_MAG26-735 [uncultured Chloroflexia bacterium]
MEAPAVWPNRTHCAMSLTYDDALIAHYTTVDPDLVRNGLRGRRPTGRRNLRHGVGGRAGDDA